jgi:2-keto-4-pentenoate hydratase/2-oxohepta-3-ene-1,7-dioic acid hydratase in catechol pathway/gentisate 1,2-dioxygenase
MKLVRFNGYRVGVTDGHKVVDASALCGATEGDWPPVAMNRLIRDFGALQPALLKLLAEQAGTPLAEVRLETPIPWPNKLMAYPVNYHDHAKEMASRGLANVQGYFLKSNSSLCGAADVIELPNLPGREVHHECEIALVIGKPCRHVPAERAMEHVFGFACLLDMTVRGKEERVFRKSYDTFTPVGPWIVTADEVPDVANIDMKLWVNGELRQQANTRDLIVDMPNMVSIASSASTLYPGDMIATGTPAGVGPVRDGDRVTIEVEHVGRMTLRVVQGSRGANVVLEKPYEFHAHAARPPAMTPEVSKRDLMAASDLNGLYPVLANNLMTAGWHKKRASLWQEPRTEYRPLHWRYEVGVLALDQAGRWMDTKLAERRNLLLYNPVGDNDYDTVRTLVAAYQMIKPGEHARAHRHSPNALRLVLDAEPDACYTVVDGVKLPMRSGDLLLTPGNAWHSHFNVGHDNAYWIDVLDVPLVHRLEPMFVDYLPGGTQQVQSSPDAHPCYFPRADVLSQMAPLAAQDGVKRLRLGTPDVWKTIALTYRQFAGGAREAARTDTANHIFCVLSGRGTARIGDQTFEFSRGDVMAAPSWKPYSFEAGENDTLLVEMSDEPVMRLLGFYREQA